MNLRHILHRLHHEHDCKEALEWAGYFIDYLTGLLEAAGIEYIHASTLINESELLTMFVGATAQATVAYADNNNNPVEAPAGTTVAFSSDNDAVATVDPTSGLVTAVAAGTCNIGATSTFPDAVTLTLTPAAVTVEVPDPASGTVTVA